MRWSASGEAAIVHAVGLPYRERSHFDAQQVLESGGTRPYELSTGWLGRALAASGSKGLALNTTVPLVLRGRADVDTWAPSVLPDPSADLVARLERMYAGDPALATALRAGAPASRRHARGRCRTRAPATMAGSGAAPGRLRRLVAPRAPSSSPSPNGPQAAVLEIGGWDTHANQANPNGALAAGLRQLDLGLAALRNGLAPAAPGSARSWSWSASSAARSRSTARSAPTTAPAASPSCSAARSRAAACHRRLAGPGEGPAPRGPRPAHHHRPARACSRACSATTCRSPRAASTPRSSPTARKVKPLQLLRG